jgi:anti-anti-sigma regulatory factor
MGSDEEAVYWINENDDSVLIRIKGRASYLNCQVLNDFLRQKLEQKCLKYCFLFDQCLGIDSTCLGILTGLALKLKRQSGICVFSGLRPRQMETIRLLGLDQLVQIVEDCSNVGPEDYSLISTKPDALQPDLIINAHKFLMEINAQNRVRFKDVVQCLSLKK